MVGFLYLQMKSPNNVDTFNRHRSHGRPQDFFQGWANS